jgi:malonate transporter and related proteins
MNSVLEVVLPVFGVLALGYLAARAGAFDDAANRGLSLFVFAFALPLLLFQAIASADLPGEVPWSFLASYYGGSFITMGLSMAVSRYAFRRRLDEQGVMALGAAFSNTSMLGIPLILTSFGSRAALPLFILLAVHSLALLPVTTGIIEAGRGKNQRIHLVAAAILRGLASNPIILGLVAGLLCNLIGLAIPATIQSITKSLGAAAIPCALFSLGASMTRYRISGNLSEPLILVILKTVIHPGVVWLLATRVFDLPNLWSSVAVTLAALPAGINGYLFAQRYNICVATTATAILISTGFSALTLSGLIYVLVAP